MMPSQRSSVTSWHMRSQPLRRCRHPQPSAAHPGPAVARTALPPQPPLAVRPRPERRDLLGPGRALGFEVHRLPALRMAEGKLPRVELERPGRDIQGLRVA